jgi:hypothetical protein
MAGWFPWPTDDVVAWGFLLFAGAVLIAVWLGDRKGG